MTSNQESIETIRAVTGDSREPYVTSEITGYREQTIAEIERFPSIRVSSIIETNQTTGRETLDRHSVGELIDLLERAGKSFAEDALGPDETRPEEYIENVVRVTGLPITTVRSAVETIRNACKNIEGALRAQAPNDDLSAFDHLRYETVSNTVGYVPEGNNLGLLAPSNHPAVLALALVAYCMKYPLTVRPSDDDPFTPSRIVHALREAGCPEKSLVLLPGDREVGSKILEQSDMGIGFGGDTLQQRYATASDVKIHGPGNSKIFVAGDRVESADVAARLEDAMMSDGGRGCINMSQIVTTGDAKILAEKLAERVANTTIQDPLTDGAVVPAVPDPDRARQFDRLIEQGLSEDGGEDVTDRYDPRDRVIERDGVTYLRPTVVRLEWSQFENRSHELFRELPFQYATVVSVPKEATVSALSTSLAVTVLADDQELERELLREPSVEKLYANGELTCDIDLREPHEGYLSDFLFTKQAYRMSR